MLEKSKKSWYYPTIVYGCEDHAISLSITGESYPENAVAHYADVFEWLEKAFEQPEHIPFQLILNLRYCNTGSIKVLDELCEKLQQHYLRTTRSVHATFKVQEDDEELLEAAQELFAPWDAERYTIERYA